jgi:DNA-binding PadR family transcriptional regulator
MTVSRKLQERDVAVLQLLWAMPTHPYDLERQLSALGYTWSTHGAVIRHLKGLQAAGLVTSAWETPQDGRARLIYTVTEAGVAYLQRTRGGVSPRRY